MEEKIFTYQNAIVRVHIPTLNEERIKRATEGLLLELIKKGYNINDKDIKEVERKENK